MRALQLVAAALTATSFAQLALAQNTPSAGSGMRIFFVHHITWSINSICHYHGARRFDTDDESTNVWWLSLASLGEAWHHNHHAFPRSAFHGLRWWELDPSGLDHPCEGHGLTCLERRVDRARAPGPAAGCGRRRSPGS